LAADRVGHLTVLAAARGIIDFREARLLDPSWWRRCRWLLAVVAADVEAAAVAEAYRFDLAQVGNSALSDDSFSKAQDRAIAAYHALRSIIRPWDERKPETSVEGERARLVQAYKQLIGDPADPEFRRKQDAMLAEARRKREAAAQQRTVVDEARRKLASQASRRTRRR